MSYQTVIKGARVVTASGATQCDIGINNGVITTLGLDLKNAEDTIDASDLIALPGGMTAMYIYLSPLARV